jgi:uncharacterized membrane-anchored protein YhcB (DUF1043 family)
MMVMIVAATGAMGWVVLIIAGVAGLTFGMLINSLLARRRKK